MSRGSIVRRPGAAPRAITLRFLLVPLLLAPIPGAAEPPAAQASEDVVSLGRPVNLDGDVLGSVISVGGNILIRGRVGRDVVAVGSDITLAPSAEVQGDVLAVGGSVQFLPPGGAYVKGRLLTLAALEAAFISELQTSPLAPSAGRSGLLLGFRLLVLFLWLLAGTALLRLSPRAVSSAAVSLRSAAGPTAVMGTGAVLGGLFLSAFLLVALPPRLGLPLTLACVAVLAAAKVFGLVSLFLGLGRLLVGKVPRGSLLFGDPAALAAGLLALGFLSLVPVAGVLVWSAASILGIGLSLVFLIDRTAEAITP